MNLKLIELINKEEDGPQLEVLVMSFIGGFSFALLLIIINHSIGITTRAGGRFALPLFLILILVCMLTNFAKRYTLNNMLKMTEKAVSKIRVELLDKLRKTELSFIEQTESGEIYSRIVKDTQAISEAAPHLITTSDAMFSCIAVLLYIASISTTCFFITLLSLYGMYKIFFSNYDKIKDELTEVRVMETDFLNLMHDTLLGYKELKMNRKKSNALFSDLKKLSEASEKLKVKAEIKNDRNVVLYIELYLCILIFTAFIMPLYSSIQGTELIKVITAMLFILGIFNILPRGLYFITQSNLAILNIEKLEKKLDAFDSSYALVPTMQLNNFKTISLVSMAARYTNKEGELLFSLKPINLQIKQGEVLFIVGGNGSGKSTLLKLLSGLYYPFGKGYIEVDGNKILIQEYPSYRELFSAIFTDFHLFKKLYGIEDVDENHVKMFLEEMDIRRKTNYAKGEFSNTDLSTGQRKRLAYIAAILEDKPIYIFDEWAADQDPVFRKLFYKKFLNDLRAMKKTVIVVTHDDRYFNAADRIIKMKEGRAVCYS